MPIYKYKSISRDGKIRLGNLDAANEADLEKRLSKMKLDLIKADESTEKRKSFGRVKVEKSDLIVFCLHMGQLVRAGVPLVSSLADLRDSIEQESFREVVANLIDLIEGGKSLSEALSEYPAIFDHFFISLIKAGEASGQLAAVFDSLAETLKWQDELQKNTKKLLLTPIFVGSVVILVTIFLMVYLVPQLVGFISNMGQELPLHTKALIATSNFMVNFWYIWLPAPIVFYIALQAAIHTNEKARYSYDKFKIELWKIGPVSQKIILSRFANFFAMMYSAGIPVLNSLEIAEGIIDNRVIHNALAQAREDIEQGEPISQSFENTGIFPPLVVRMLKIGETTGGLDKALLNVSYFYERDIKDSIDKLQAMIQPIMTIFVGGLLGWVMISVMGPVYDSLSNIGI